MKIEFRDLQGNFIFYDVKLESFVVGRSRKCDITVADESISREHLRVNVKSDGDATVHDLGSSNGTFINDKKMTPNIPEAFTTLFSFSLGKGILMRLMEESEDFPADAEVNYIRDEAKKLRPDQKLQTRSIPTKMSRTKYGNSTSQKAVRKQEKKGGMNIVRILMIIAIAFLVFLFATES